MKLPPIYRGRKINKMLCIMFVILFVISMAAGILVNDFGLVLAQIMGLFALLYGLLWAIWAGREKAAEDELRELAEECAAERDGDRSIQHEYLLPREQLTDAAFHRFISCLKWSACITLCVFVLLTGLLIREGSFNGLLHAIVIMLFCIIITIPGIIIQWRIYRKYTSAVPRSIGLYPGKIMIDDSAIPGWEIREIQISPDRVYNPHSPVVFREMVIQTTECEKHYRIDFRSGGLICWKEYPQFSEALSDWGRENRVPVKVMYME